LPSTYASMFAIPRPIVTPLSSAFTSYLVASALTSVEPYRFTRRFSPSTSQYLLANSSVNSSPLLTHIRTPLSFSFTSSPCSNTLRHCDGTITRRPTPSRLTPSTHPPPSLTSSSFNITVSTPPPNPPHTSPTQPTTFTPAFSSIYRRRSPGCSSSIGK